MTSLMPALKSLNLANKKDDELKQIASILPKNLLTNLIKNKALETVKLQTIIQIS